eukprot:172474_1
MSYTSVSRYNEKKNEILNHADDLYSRYDILRPFKEILTENDILTQEDVKIKINSQQKLQILFQLSPNDPISEQLWSVIVENNLELQMKQLNQKKNALLDAFKVIGEYSTCLDSMESALLRHQGLKNYDRFRKQIHSAVYNFKSLLMKNLSDVSKIQRSVIVSDSPEQMGTALTKKSVLPRPTRSLDKIQHAEQGHCPITIGDSICNILQISNQMQIKSAKNQFEMDSIDIQNSKVLKYSQQACRTDFSNTINNVFKCSHLIQLKDAMRQYTVFRKTVTNVNEYKIDQVDVLTTLNSFLHLLQTHDDDHQVEMIKKLLNIDCNIRKCKIFHDICQMSNNYQAHFQILDKIHCYYEHCYDLGNRLLIQEKMMIIDSIEDIEHESSCLESDQIKQLNHILADKYQNKKLINRKKK